MFISEPPTDSGKIEIAIFILSHPILSENESVKIFLTGFRHSNNDCHLSHPMLFSYHLCPVRQMREMSGNNILFHQKLRQIKISFSSKRLLFFSASPLECSLCGAELLPALDRIQQLINGLNKLIQSDMKPGEQPILHLI